MVLSGREDGYVEVRSSQCLGPEGMVFNDGETISASGCGGSSDGSLGVIIPLSGAG